MTRQDALVKIVSLAREYGIGASEISEALARPVTSKETTSVLMRVLSYLGGAFIFAGISAYISLFWGQLGSAPRVMITLGTGFLALALAIIFSKDKNAARATSIFLLIAGIMQPVGLSVMIREYFNNGGDWHLAALLIFGFMLVQQLCLFLAMRNPILLFFAIASGMLLVGDIFDWMNVSDNFSSMIVGLSMLLIAYGLQKTPYNRVSWFWYLVGSLSVSFGAFDMLVSTRAEILYVGVCVLGVYLSTLIRSNVTLVISVLSLITYIGYFSSKHFLHSVGWPITLVLFGLVMVSIGAGAFKIKKKYIG